METGATEEQVEAGAKRYFTAYENVDPDAYREWEQVGKRERAIYADIAEAVLSGACPPDHRIVSLRDLKRLFAAWEGFAVVTGWNPNEFDGRIRTLIGDDEDRGDPMPAERVTE